MRKYLICAVITVLCLLCYLLFEPMFIYNFGWEPLTNDQKSKSEVIHDSTFYRPILLTQKYLDDSIALKTPGLSVAVGINGKLVWSSTRGYADVETKKLVTPNTAFRIGSTSKAVTSIGLGILLEQGKLGLDDTIAPGIMDKTITIKQLASHTSGIRNYGMCFCFPVWEYYNNDEYTSVKEAVKIFNDDPLLFEPGTDFSYSSYNFTALSAAMEHAAGIEFTEFMESMVFRKAGMVNTGFDKQNVNIDRAEFYDVQTNIYKKAFTVDNSNKWAGGGMLSTPSDLVILGNAILTGSIINPETFKTLTTPVRLANGEINEQNYALGWRSGELDLLDVKAKVTILHHGGTATGSTALWIIVPEYNLTAAIMINRSVEGFPLFDILLPIVEYFVNELNTSRD
ncbi:MAG: serine hydrolase domain-containing protein [Marinoscillum sp.]